MRKVLSLLVAFFLFFPTTVYALNAVDVSASSAIVIVQKTKQVLFEKNAYVKLPMASTTKIMTALLALEYGKPDDIVTINKAAAGVEGSSIYLEEGEKIRLIDLTYGLLLNSGNDAAVAIAQHISGSVDEFVALMNKKAQEIGANNTCFKNPNGLSQVGHYTTAYDLALISAYALSNPDFAQIVKTQKYISNNAINSKVKVFVNHNKLLSMYPGCDGVKTGYTKDSGRTLVSSATKNGFQAVCVTLNAPNDWQDHTDLFNAVFSTHTASKLIESGKVMKTVSVKDGDKDKIHLYCKEDFTYPVFEDELQKVSYVYHISGSFKAPLEKDQKVGSVDVYYQKQLLNSFDLYTDAYVVKVETKPDLGEIFNNITNNWLMIFNNSRII